MQTELAYFAERQDRPRFIGKRFARALAGSVLDVGCDRAALRDLIGAERYTGIDVSREADVHQDLMQDGELPFNDGSCDAVVCLDVLEHLENLHQLFGELIRVSRRHIVVSLPNNWCGARRRLSRGHGSIAHYGLPLDPPIDRHRWFFGLTEAHEFLEGMACRHGLDVEELVALEAPRAALLRGLRHIRYPKRERYLNRYAHTLICVYRKG
jgi:SAM-dependent methyltransferase